MKVIRWVLKALLLPVKITLMLLLLFVEFLAGMSLFVFRGIAFLFLLTALLSYGFGLESADRCFRMVLSGFLFYLLPCMLEIIFTIIVFLEEWLSSLI